MFASGCGDPKTPTDPGGPPQEHVVLVADFQFTPARLVVRRGDTVTWRNTGGFHNVAADDGSFQCAEGCDGNGSGDPSAVLWTFSRSFTAAGDVPYHCMVHGGSGGRGMSGVIVVEP